MNTQNTHYRKITISKVIGTIFCLMGFCLFLSILRLFAPAPIGTKVYRAETFKGYDSYEEVWDIAQDHGLENVLLAQPGVDFTKDNELIVLHYNDEEIRFEGSADLSFYFSMKKGVTNISYNYNCDPNLSKEENIARANERFSEFHDYLMELYEKGYILDTDYLGHYEITRSHANTYYSPASDLESKPVSFNPFGVMVTEEYFNSGKSESLNIVMLDVPDMFKMFIGGNH